MDPERKHIYQTLLGVILLFGFSFLVSLAPFAMLSSLTSAVVVSCVHNQPQLSLTHHDFYPATATSAYLLTVTNRDSGPCESSIFDLQTDLPGSSIGVFSKDPVSLAPGASETLNLLLVADTTLSSQQYSFTVVATPLADPALAARITPQQQFP